MKRILLIGGLVWVVLISAMHARMNLKLDWDFFRPAADKGPAKFRVGFLPVTCHLTCPVTHFINKNMSGDDLFEPVRFNGWPELKEAYLAGYTPATFILAPMAITGGTGP